MTQLLSEYEANRNKEWIKKTTVLNLIITASISTYTYRQGADQINIPFDLLGNYLENLVLPELQDGKINNLS